MKIFINVVEAIVPKT